MLHYNKDIIKSTRVMQNRSMESVAEEVNTSRQRYSRYEDNPGIFNLDFNMKVLNALKIDKKDFFMD